MQFIVVAIIGLCILAAVFISYFVLGGFALGPSSSTVDWGAFGSYFGGVAGPLLTFISVVLIVYTLRQQRFQLESMSEENLKQDMLRYLSKIDDEISHLLTRRIQVGDYRANNTLVGNERYVEIGDMISGLETPDHMDEQSYKAAMDKLLRLTASYCEAIALYRANINGYFIFRAYQQRGEELVCFLEKNTKYLYQMAVPTLGFCKMHLEGRENG